MKRSAQILIAASLAIIAAGARVTMAAEVGAQEEALVNLKASSQVISAAWMRRSSSLSLQLVLDNSAQTKPAAADLGPVPGPDDRRAFFIGNTIASLRGLSSAITAPPPPSPVPQKPARPVDPVTLRALHQQGLVNEELLSVTPVALPSAMPCARTAESRVDVWLLKADGTQILPSTYSCDTPRQSPSVTSISYGFPVSGSTQAVAAAVRIDDNFYIEKLQPPLAAPAAP